MRPPATGDLTLAPACAVNLEDSTQNVGHIQGEGMPDATQTTKPRSRVNGVSGGEKGWLAAARGGRKRGEGERVRRRTTSYEAAAWQQRGA